MSRLGKGKGTIPACAGEPSVLLDCPLGKGDYPRVCGGTSRAFPEVWPTRGLSPRVRGNPARRRKPPSGSGTIPACAGEPPSPYPGDPGAWDYPRVCGGTKDRAKKGEIYGGLSPRVRGNRRNGSGNWRRRGTIPACAGEPPVSAKHCQHVRDYPRVCGGTSFAQRLYVHTWGLSPRVRGNQHLMTEISEKEGTIPACAGEPDEEWVHRLYRGDYPRVCGGTSSASSTIVRSMGLSPRVRGNPGNSNPVMSASGTIPACAGEPSTLLAARRMFRDYPRVCGGTMTRQISASDTPGLSPRVRGNLRPRRRIPGQDGTIPACAGEPHQSRVFCLSERDYPRVCGGTDLAVLTHLEHAGLSPRVRGNPGPPGHLWIIRGTIPACAGEPVDRKAGAGNGGDYPRVCGGTYGWAYRVLDAQGLSPRVRGNLGASTESRPAIGTIPACAGEPGCWTARSRSSGDYPRVCGGTMVARSILKKWAGLSPRVRGNRLQPVCGGHGRGTIPACAGEPTWNG